MNGKVEQNGWWFLYTHSESSRRDPLLDCRPEFRRNGDREQEVVSIHDGSTYPGGSVSGHAFMLIPPP
jgi:hypothetical protein